MIKKDLIAWGRKTLTLPLSCEAGDLQGLSPLPFHAKREVIGIPESETSEIVTDAAVQPGVLASS